MTSHQLKENYRLKNNKKYCNLVLFGNSISQILDDCHYIINEQNREKVDSLTGLDRLALSILLMDECNFRVGNLKHKKSTGLLTIETKHFNPSINNIEFSGKKRVINSCFLKDRQIIDEIRELWNEVDQYSTRSDGKKLLFSYDGGAHRVNTDDLNQFLKIYHPSFTAKMFRTWKANFYFLESLSESTIPTNREQMNKNIKNAIEYAAEKLYHTPTICKRSYIDERLTDLYRTNPELFQKNVELVDLLKRFCS